MFPVTAKCFEVHVSMVTLNY